MKSAKAAALEVLRHNIHGPFQGLPRTAGWGYPEPYTRDWMIASLGILVSKDAELMDGLRRLLLALAGGRRHWEASPRSPTTRRTAARAIPRPCF